MFSDIILLSFFSLILLLSKSFLFSLIILLLILSLIFGLGLKKSFCFSLNLIGFFSSSGIFSSQLLITTILFSCSVPFSSTELGALILFSFEAETELLFVLFKTVFSFLSTILLLYCFILIFEFASEFVFKSTFLFSFLSTSLLLLLFCSFPILFFILGFSKEFWKSVLFITLGNFSLIP